MTQLEFKFANSNSGSCKTTRAQYSSSFLTAPVEVFFRSTILRMHAWQTVFCQPSSIYQS